jgi:hypothetical protein
MLRNAIVVLAIVLVLGSSGLPASYLPAAAVMVTVAEVMVFAAITLAAASVVLPVTAMAVTVTRQRFAWRISPGRGPRCVGPLGHLLWAYDSHDLSWDCREHLRVAVASAARSIQRECLDHVVLFAERHLRRPNPVTIALDRNETGRQGEAPYLISAGPRQPRVWGSLTRPLPQPPTRELADKLGHVLVGGRAGSSVLAMSGKAGLV